MDLSINYILVLEKLCILQIGNVRVPILASPRFFNVGKEPQKLALGTARLSL